MRAPEGLDATGRAAWRRAHAVLVAIGEDPGLCEEPLGAYARAAGDVGRLRQWRAEGELGTIVGARGQPIVNPLLVAIEKSEHLAAEQAARLGLDPQARRRLSRRVTGRAPGAASAPDRAAPTQRRTLKRVQ